MDQRSGRSPLLAVAATLVLGLLAGIGGYAVGQGGGADADAARAAGAHIGTAQGARRGEARGYRAGFAAGRAAAQRRVGAAGQGDGG